MCFCWYTCHPFNFVPPNHPEHTEETAEVLKKAVKYQHRVPWNVLICAPHCTFPQYFREVHAFEKKPSLQLPEPWNLTVGTPSWAKDMTDRIVTSDGLRNDQYWNHAICCIQHAGPIEAMRPFMYELEREVWLRIWRRQPSNEKEDWDEIRAHMAMINAQYPNRSEAHVLESIRLARCDGQIDTFQATRLSAESSPLKRSF